MPINLTSLELVADTSRFSCYVTETGELQAVGETNGIPLGLTGIRQLAGGFGGYGLALMTNGSVVGWRLPNLSFQIPASLTNIIAIAAAPDRAMALRANGTLVTWGSQISPGQPLNIPPGLMNIVRIACGDSFSVAVRADGTARAWGSYFNGEYSFGDQRIVDVAAGSLFFILLLDDGTVRTFGDAVYTVPTGTGN